MKIATIGHPGSGKTYIANALGETLGIKVIVLDSIIDKYPLSFISKRLYRKQFCKLFNSKADWVIDGYHGKRMPDWIWETADVIIFSDLPRPTLKKNVVARQREAKNSGELSHGQHSRLNSLISFGKIHFLDKSLNANVRRIAGIKKKNSKFISLHSMKEVEKFLDDFCP